MVEQILDLLEQGRTFAEIVDRYFPDLTPDDLRASLRFARELVENEEIHVVEERRAG